MMRTGVRIAVGAVAAAAGLMWASLAAAGPAAPGLLASAGPAGPAAAAPVTWVCGPYRCDWRPGARVAVPGYAVRWGPPPQAWCYWSKVRGPYGGWRWVQVCRR